MKKKNVNKKMNLIHIKILIVIIILRCFLKIIMHNSLDANSFVFCFFMKYDGFFEFDGLICLTRLLYQYINYKNIC